MKEFELESYLTHGVEKIIKGILQASVHNPDAGLSVLKYAKLHKKAAALRHESERQGLHIPPFLIASITNRCNLHCKGCYARANHSCIDGAAPDKRRPLSDSQWADIFSQAAGLGVSFILIAGGEPFVRRDVLQAATACKEILFPVFTNGTMIDEAYMELLSYSRNVIPILSMEGKEQTTDLRRGAGIFRKLQETMGRLYERGILFGASITVHKENMQEVMGDEFLKLLKDAGCQGIVYVEYVPMGETDAGLALDDDSRERMMERLNQIRRKDKEMLLLAFPGDEKSSGGCLAAGRGFFHINPYGGAEPCPFSPYSDTELTETSLVDALHSPLFQRLRSEGILLAEHIGGCVLHGQQDRVLSLLGGEQA